MTRPSRARRTSHTIGALGALFVLVAPASARAESDCPRLLASTLPPSIGARLDWPTPLDRAVTLRAPAVPLRAALDRIAESARLRLSYSRELIPVDRSVCLAYDKAPVGEILAHLLEGTGMEAIAVGNEQVVLAPQRRTPATRAPLPARDLAVSAPAVLAPVVVRDRTDPARSAPSGTSSTTINTARLVNSGLTTVSQILGSAIPGMWMWDNSSSSAMAQYGSLRGASSFGVGAPKVYIDGVEMANPLTLTQLDPNTIESLEVIRGPQGSALYGTDAIDGVIRITTRHEGGAGGRPRLSLRSETGMAQSDFSSGGVLSQDHALSVRGGSAFRSASLGLSASTLGDYVPGAEVRRLGLSSGVRILGRHGSFSAFTRLSSERVGNVTSPLLAGIEVPPPVYQPTQPQQGTAPGRSDAAALGYDDPTSTAPQSMNAFTVGFNASIAGGGRWTHTVVAGIDGYQLRNVAYDLSPVPTAADSALQASRGSSQRLTLRASSVAAFGGGNAAARATLSGDISTLRREVELRNGWGSDAEPTLFGLPWRTNTGITSQLDAALWQRLSITTGVRLERDADQLSAPRVSVLPMVGATLAHDAGLAHLKLRGAWGKAIRQPQLALLGGNGRGTQLLQTTAGLLPEQQVGLEGGLDLELGEWFGVHVTRFDQRATNLIQAVTRTTGAMGGAQGSFTLPYTLQNVGEITNRGWELAASATMRTLRLDATFTTVDSRVAAVSSSYRGDLRAGDRTLQVPARIGSLTTTWNPRGWSLALGAARAWDWINYDRLALAQDAASGWSTFGGRRPSGDALRTYWMQYDGVTRLRASIARDLFRGIALRVSGENLLGAQRGEPDNVTVVPGRTLRIGVTTHY